MTFRSTISHLVETRGSSRERQLLARWQQPFTDFLDGSGHGLTRGQQALEVELETDLALTATVRSRTLPPVLALNRLADSLPGLAGVCAGHAAKSGLPCDLGLRLTAAGCQYLIYLYEQDDRIARFLATRTGRPLLTGAGLWQVANDDAQALVSSRHDAGLAELWPDARQQLATLLRIPLDDQPGEYRHWLGWRDGSWQPVRGELVLHQVPLTTATRLISEFRPPCFGYLAPYAPYARITLAWTPGGVIDRWAFER